MGVAMTVESSGSEVYTTSARVARHVNTSALSGPALTEIIIEAQNEIDAFTSDDYTTVPYSTVPEIITDIATDLAIAKVISETLVKGNTGAGSMETVNKFRAIAMAKLQAVNDGQYELYAAGTLVSRTYSRETAALVAAATPSGSMTIISGMSNFDLRDYRVIGICTATSGSPTGWVKITGTLDEREQLTDQLYFDGQREVQCRVPFQSITGVDASGLTGGTAPLFALKAVRNTGKTFAGGRA